MADIELAALRVLVVEDDALAAVDVAAQLQRLGCTVAAEANSLAAATTALRTTELDIAVLDLDIGGEPVFPFATMLARRGVPFLFMTGQNAEAVRFDFRLRPVVLKPVGEVQLREAMVAALDRRPAT
jgi:CheY-like chemotaxis protein